MLCCRVLRSGGHGDLFPTSKAAAHLTPRWILSRSVPHAPGTGKCYADFTHPGERTMYQLKRPDVHERKAVPMNTYSSMRHGTTQRMSPVLARQTVASVAASMSHHHAKTNDNPVARANIEAKEASEVLARTRDFTAPRAVQHYKKGYEPRTDFFEGCAYMGRRCERHIKLEDTNPLGYSKEWFPQEVNPPAKPAPPSKKK